MNQIQEQNKMIAEFDKGARMRKFVEGYAGTCMYIGNKRWCRFEDLKYHTSWDWLMPVVEKIEKEGCKVEISSLIQSFNDGPEIIYHQDVSIFHDVTCIVEVTSLSKLNSVYEAVIKFITWYNANKSK